MPYEEHPALSVAAFLVAGTALFATLSYATRQDNIVADVAAKVTPMAESARDALPGLNGRPVGYHAADWMGLFGTAGNVTLRVSSPGAGTYRLEGVDRETGERRYIGTFSRGPARAASTPGS